MMQKKVEQRWWDKYSNEEGGGVKKVDGWNKNPRLMVHKMCNILMDGYVQTLIDCFEQGFCCWVWESDFILRG